MRPVTAGDALIGAAKRGDELGTSNETVRIIARNWRIMAS
jgi:hypothetical protein